MLYGAVVISLIFVERAFARNPAATVSSYAGFEEALDAATGFVSFFKFFLLPPIRSRAVMSLVARKFVKMAFQPNRILACSYN